MTPISPTKELISDALAWIAFNALLLWLLTLIVGLSGYWWLYEQIMAFVDLIQNCEGNHCAVQLTLDSTDTDSEWLGIDVSILQALRMPAFLTWLGIVFFQSFFVGRARLKPWCALAHETQ